MSRVFFSDCIIAPKKYGNYKLELKKDGGLDYSELDAYPESVKWWVSTFAFLTPVVKSFKNGKESSEKSEYIKRFIAGFFSRNESVETQSFSRAWDGHAVSKRSLILLEISEISNISIDEILYEHLYFLVKDENFQGHWNHGLDQSYALARLAQYFDDQKSLEVAVNRLIETLSNLVDDEGVSVEQAVHYHLYNYVQIKRVLKLFSDLEECFCKGLANKLSEKLRLMELFLAHTTTPDGRYFEIGDTPQQSAAPIQGTVAEYAATQGKKGLLPPETIKIYSSGYIFGRTGWGKERSFAEESCFCVRFGPKRMIHGHHDHMSIQYYAGGKLILRDGGFHGYTHDQYRDLLRSPQSHNTIHIEGKRTKLKSNPTKLVESFVANDYCKFVLLGSPYENVTHERTIFFIKFPETLVVRDSVTSKSHVNVVQKWQFGNDLSFYKEDDGHIVSIDKTISAQQHYPFKESTVFNVDDVDNPAIVAGDSLYKLTKSPALITEREGKKISFLTTFVIGDNASNVIVKRKSLKGDEVRQRLVINDGVDRATLDFLSDGSVVWFEG